jgi:hypothetical protein
MSQIIICAPSYHEGIGGGLVLHKLCHILNNIGYDAYLTSTPKLNGSSLNFNLNPEWNTKLAESFNPTQDIIIYPEIERGNIYEGKNVVRYILGKNHLVDIPEGTHSSTWGENDYWLYFHDLFYDEIKPKNILHVIDSKADKFIHLSWCRDMTKTCFTYRKKQDEKENLNIIHPSDSIEINFNTPDSELIKIFRSCKTFYSYDTETYLSVLAALCGCESVIVPYKNITKEEIVSKQPSFKYGIAYGLNDLEWANNTQPKLREHMIMLEEKQIEDTKIEFEKIFKYFNI